MASLGSKLLRIGFVPEHFSTPLHYAQTRFRLGATLVPFPSGTGHMITALRAREIDVGIGLTEAWIAGLAGRRDPEPNANAKAQAQAQARSNDDTLRQSNDMQRQSIDSQVSSKPSSAVNDSDPDYRLVGTYVETPLVWAVSTGGQRKEIASLKDLRGRRLGVSRIGSGSHIMAYVLAEQQGWLNADQPPFSIVPVGPFAALRAGVNNGSIDAFMWETFTSRRYFAPPPSLPASKSPDLASTTSSTTSSSSSSDLIKPFGEIPTPWPSWHIVASTELLAARTRDNQNGTSALDHMFRALDQGIRYFETHPDESVEYISTALDYSAADAREWLKTVRFAQEGVAGVRASVVQETLAMLKRAGIVKEDATPENMTA